MKRINLLLLVGLCLLTVATASQESVTIKNVDNYAGISNVYTDRPNTEIKVTELNEDGEPLRSWTGNTDSDGKLTITAGHNLSKRYLKATVISKDQMADLLVVPNSLSDGQAFTFAAGGLATGEVVQIWTVAGEVVAQKTPDRLGRVYLPAGLAAGSYLVSVGGSGQQRGQIVVKPRPQDALVRPGTITPGPLKLADAAAIRVGFAETLNGEGFSPNATDMKVRVGDVASTVLAATDTEMKLAPIANKPGYTQLNVANTATGQSISKKVLCYELKGKLTQEKVPAGASTMLQVTMEPRNVQGNIRAHIVSGPVSFSQGRSEAAIALKNGVANIPIYSLAGGIGQFNVSYSCDFLGEKVLATDTKDLDAGRIKLEDLTDKELVELRKDLNRRKDDDSPKNGGSGENHDYLWGWIKRIEDELVDNRGYSWYYPKPYSNKERILVNPDGIPVADR